MSHFTSESTGNHDLFAFEDQPPPLDTDFNFQQKVNKTDEVGDFHKFDDTFDMKASPVHANNQKTDADLLGDFLSHERQAPAATIPRPKDSPPAIPTFEAFDVQAEINASAGKIESHPKEVEEDFGPIQPDYLNPYATAGKLESNEKFISTDDLIGLSDNEGKAEKENAFEDCNKEEYDEEVIHAPPVAKVEEKLSHAQKQEPVLPPEPANVTTKPPAAEPSKPKEQPSQKKEKPVELLEAEKLFIKCGLGKSIFFLFFYFCARSQ